MANPLHDPFDLDGLAGEADHTAPAPRREPAPPPPAREPPYLAALNPEQRRAVETLDGPLLVLAGAGTGKTRVLTTRIAHILWTRRASPSQILAVTFTNKAAREMRERVGHLVGGAVEGMPWLGTFHALGARILRRHAELARLKSNFTILDVDDQIRLMRQVLSAENVDERRWPARALAGHIDSWKNRGLAPDKVPANEAQGFANGRGIDLYRQYQERLKTLNATDFGDLLLDCLTIFQQHPELLEDYRRRFRYLLVDEYQDTNVAQYLWLRLLAGPRRPDGPNLCCVGDDDQSIYGWRGAEVGNILRFEKDFPGATIIRLERNYRSTPHILGAASGLIAANAGRLGKTLRSEVAASGEKVQVRGVWDAEEEARVVAEEIENLQRKGHRLSAVAILVRTGFQTRTFEERFLSLAIPYRMIGGTRFYERAEIRDAMAYLRVVAQPEDSLAFERILNKPKRGLGEATVQILHQTSRAQSLSLLEAARLLSGTEEVRPRARAALGELVRQFDGWRARTRDLPHAELAEIVLEESGYTEMWRLDRSAEAAGKLDNLKELIRAMEEFGSLTDFLEHVALVMENEQADSDDKVNLMTLHSAKGLEFDTVFLPGWEEGLFPHQRSLDESGIAGLEEERRLAYVGLTRARARASVLYAANRRMHGLWQAAVPSRFVDELPADHVEIENAPGIYGGMGGSQFEERPAPFTSAYDTPGWRRARDARRGEPQRRTDPRIIEGQAELVVTSEPTSTHRPGERVFHLKFGYGRIVAVDGNKLTVDFEKAGTKKVVDSFVERA